MRRILPPSLLILVLSRSVGAASIEGYAWPPSVAQGDTVDLHVSTDVAFFDIEFCREGRSTTPYLEVHGLPGTLQAVPDSAWQGCDWDPSYSLAVPVDWPSGVYVARLIAPGAQIRHAIFVVKEDQPGSTSPILFQCSIATWQAYNRWGGKCLYDELSSDGERAYVVSFRRPHGIGEGRGNFEIWARPLVAWLETEGYAVEYCTDLDTHADPALESHYDLLLVAGHDEYWSREMRDHVEARIAAGRHVAFLGGNACWWQIRYGPGLDRVICYKSATLDPLYGVQDSLVTVLWHEPPLERPPNTMTGVSTRGGGYPREPLPYIVEQAGHWVFEGTGVSNGEAFGGERGVVEGEVDGAAFVRIGGMPVVTGEDGTPLAFEILATGSFTGGYGPPPYDEGTATMGVCELGGTVFTASSLGWSRALWPIVGDAVARRITENVISRTVAGDPFWAEPGDVVLEDVTWSTQDPNVNFVLSFRNNNATSPSRGVHGFLEAHALGDFLAPAGPQRPFDLPSISPGAASHVELTFPRSDLPSVERVDPFGSPLPGCPEDATWAGGTTVHWRETGVPDMATRTFERATLTVCPGGGPSYVRVTLGCGDPAGTSWSVTPPGGLWTADLCADSSGVPGGAAPDPVPPGAFAAWIAVSAAPAVPPWTTWEPELRLSCGVDSARVLVRATSCACQEPNDAPSTEEKPAALRLDPCSPNPFSLGTRIDYALPSPARASLRIYDVSGRLVRTIRDAAGAAGGHVAWWDGSDDSGRRASPGLYFYRLSQGDRSLIHKAVLLR